jgi:O-antigen/teichoic acid export membrane protein
VPRLKRQGLLADVRAERTATAGSVILVSRFAATAVINYVVGLALAWLLTPDAFGLVSAVQNVLLLAAGLLTAGLPWALALRIAQTHGVPAASRPEFRTALVVNFGFGVALGAAFLGTQLFAVELVPSHSLILSLIVAAEMPVLAVNSTLAGAAQGSSRFGGLGAMQTTESLIKCVAAVFMVSVLHAGPTGVALSFLIGTLGSVLLGVNTCRGLLPGRGPMASLGFLRAATSIWFASASMTFLITADLLGLQFFGRTAGVTAAVLAGYQACGLLGRACYYVGDALADAVFPFMARSDDPEDRNRWFMAPMRWVMLLIVPIQVGFLLAPGPVLRLFLPAHYSGAQTLLRLIAAGTLGALMTDMLMKGLFAGGHGRQVGRRMSVAVTVEVVGLAILVPRFGAVGAGISYLLASYCGMALLGFFYLRVNRLRPPSLRQAVVYVGGITPSAVAFFLADRAASPVAWALIMVGAVLFIWPARRMRLIEDSDLNALRAWSARLGRTRAGSRITPLLGEWWLIAVCVAVAVGGLGYNLFSSPDVLYDEAAYTWAAQQVAQGWHLTLDNQPLFVHPPLMFLLQAGWLRLTGQETAALPSAIRSARLLAASAGVADVLLIAALGYRLAGAAAPRQRRALTIVIACVAAVDPVLSRYDRQNVIEPYALAAGLLTLHAAWHLADRGALPYVSVTGLLGGLTLLTNEIAVALVVVPLLAAILQRDRTLIRRSAAALAISFAFALSFLAWAAELGLSGSFVTVQTSTLQRLIGLVQITGLNVPGVSLVGSLRQSVSQYSSSYIVLAIGLAALVWCCLRSNNRSGNFLTAWLMASYGLGAYIVAAGTLNEQFFVYLLPAGMVGSVLFADTLIVGRGRHRGGGRRRRHRQRHRLGGVSLRLAAGIACCAGLLGLSAVSWAASYVGPGDGAVRASQFIATRLPACAAVNASGDPQKYSYMLGGRSLPSFYVGPAALADGVHYFLLAPNDATEREGDMSPALATWIRENGQRLADFPSPVYRTVQLWHVPASPYDPVADIIDIADGVFINVIGSHCGGYSVTDGPTGAFYSGYQALGGKGVVGAPLSQVTGSGGHEQFFDGAVLAAAAGSREVHPVPMVALLAKRSPAAYRRADLPPVTAASGATTSERRGWLSNGPIKRAYLDGRADTPAAYAAAVQRYGVPLGPPTATATATAHARVSQAFANVVLTLPARGASVRAAAVTPIALAAGAVSLPPAARAPQIPPTLPDITPLGPPEPTTVEPFALTLAAALTLYAGAVAIIAFRRRRQREANR